MAAASDGMTPRMGLRNTLRFQWKDSASKVMPRDGFCKRVIKELLGLAVQDVFCLQWHQQATAYDVTLATADTHQLVLARCSRSANEHPLSLFEVVNLDRLNFRLVTVHTYNPYLTDVALKEFLSRYADTVSSPRYVKDPFGFWTGRRQFQVLLKQDAGGHDGLKHPPAFFQLGADRGYLFYARQPPFCRRCRCHGHVEADCDSVRCRSCEEEGHVASACPYDKRCNGCGQTGHLYRSCPERKRTFAEVVGETGGPRVAVSGRGSATVTDGVVVAKERVDGGQGEGSQVAESGEGDPGSAAAGQSGHQSPGYVAAVQSASDTQGTPMAHSDTARRSREACEGEEGFEPVEGLVGVKRVKGLLAVVEDEAGGLLGEHPDPILNTVSATTVPETSSTQADAPLVTFGMDFTFSPEMLALSALRGERENLEGLHTDDEEESRSWGEQVEAMDESNAEQPLEPGGCHQRFA